MNQKYLAAGLDLHELAVKMLASGKRKIRKWRGREERRA